MKVKVNRRFVELFEGARVRDAVLRYLVRRKMDLGLAETVRVEDALGHELGQDAPLSEGKVIKVKGL